MAKNKDRRREHRDGELNKLKKAIRRLESDKRKLISELSTLTAAFDQNIRFLKGATKDLTLPELIQAAKKEKNLKQINEDKEQTFEDMENKWRCHDCGTGILQIILYSNLAGQFYFRMCNNQQCKKRTTPQPWNDSVEGIRADTNKK